MCNSRFGHPWEEREAGGEVTDSTWRKRCGQELRIDGGRVLATSSQNGVFAPQQLYCVQCISINTQQLSEFVGSYWRFMSTAYLFRIDGAKDNDDFFAAMRTSVSHGYAGVDFRVGAAGWIPDLVKVVVEKSSDRCSLTLIELEATESVALISCRKYLPENSTDILNAFSDYLDRVIRQCRSTADPREHEFFRLKSVLSQIEHVTVTTAGALRSSTCFVEELPLIDQPTLVAQPRPVREEKAQPERIFRGLLRLSAQEANALARCVMIIDAIIRNRDHSSATTRTWLGRARTQPLKVLLIENCDIHPALRAFVLERQRRGATLDFEIMLSELIDIWSVALERSVDLERSRNLVSGYYPVASAIKAHDHMAAVFETARKHVGEEAI